MRKVTRLLFFASIILGLVGCSNSSENKDTTAGTTYVDSDIKVETTTEETTEEPTVSVNKVGDTVITDDYEIELKKVSYGNMYYYADSDGKGRYGELADKCDPVYTSMDMKEIRNKAGEGKKFVQVKVNVTYKGKDNGKYFYIAGIGPDANMTYGDGYEMKMVFAKADETKGNGWYTSFNSIIFDALSDKAAVTWIFEVLDDNEPLELSVRGAKFIIR